MAQDLTTDRESAILEECQHVIGYTFQQVSHLRSALTHTSSANTRSNSNERLEFLGDSILGMITCEQLFLRFPDYQEGEMTKIKSAVVSRLTCAKFSQELRLGDFLFLGRGMRTNADVPSNLLADVFESLVAAIYLDGGLEAVKPFVLQFISPEIERVARDVNCSNYKSLLQQIVQKQFGGIPRYQVLDEQGPDHSRFFKVAVVINARQFPAAWGKNKKTAEGLAAQNAIASIQGKQIPHNHDDDRL